MAKAVSCLTANYFYLIFFQQIIILCVGNFSNHSLHLSASSSCSFLLQFSSQILNIKSWTLSRKSSPMYLMSECILSSASTDQLFIIPPTGQIGGALTFKELAKCIYLIRKKTHKKQKQKQQVKNLRYHCNFLNMFLALGINRREEHIKLDFFLNSV